MMYENDNVHATLITSCDDIIQYLKSAILTHKIGKIVRKVAQIITKIKQNALKSLVKNNIFITLD